MQFYPDLAWVLRQGATHNCPILDELAQGDINIARSDWRGLEHKRRIWIRQPMSAAPDVSSSIMGG